MQETEAGLLPLESDPGTKTGFSSSSHVPRQQPWSYPSFAPLTSWAHPIYDRSISRALKLILQTPIQSHSPVTRGIHWLLQLRLELGRAQFLLLQTHRAENLLGPGLVARDARLDLVFALLVLAAAELVEMGCAKPRVSKERHERYSDGVSMEQS